MCFIGDSYVHIDVVMEWDLIIVLMGSIIKLIETFAERLLNLINF